MMRHILSVAVAFAFVAWTLIFIFNHGRENDLAFSYDTNCASLGLDSLASPHYSKGVGAYRVQVRFLDLQGEVNAVLLAARDDEVVFRKANTQHGAERLYTAMGTLTQDCVIRWDESLAHLLPFFAKQKDNKQTIHCLISNAFDLPHYTGDREWDPEGNEFPKEHASEE